MSPNVFQEAILAARDAFVEAFLARVPSYTGVSRAQLDNIQVVATGFKIKFTVPHFLYNEKHNANLVGFHLRNPGPYYSIPAAKYAAEAVLEQEFQRQLLILMKGLAWKK